MPGVLGTPETTESPPDPPPQSDGEKMPQSDIDAIKWALEFFNGPCDSEWWLNQNIDGLKIHSIEQQVKEPFEKLRQASSVIAEDDISPYLIAIDQILENIHKMRLYLDCQELNMSKLLSDCLTCKHIEIKKGACDIVTQICNREPDCKEFFTTRRFIFELVRIINHCPDDDFVTKSLDALIAVVSDNGEALEFLHYHSGLSMFCHTLARERDEWSIKIATYLEETCRMDEQLAFRLINQDYIPELVILLAKERKPSHGVLLKLLTVLIEMDYDALDELARSKLDAKEVLNKMLESSAGKPELNVERANCLWLLKSIRNLEMGKSLYDRD